MCEGIHPDKHDAGTTFARCAFVRRDVTQKPLTPHMRSYIYPSSAVLPAAVALDVSANPVDEGARHVSSTILHIHFSSLASTSHTFSPNSFSTKINIYQEVIVGGRNVLSRSGPRSIDFFNRFPFARRRKDSVEYEVYATDEGMEIRLEGRRVWGIRADDIHDDHC